MSATCVTESWNSRTLFQPKPPSWASGNPNSDSSTLKKLCTAFWYAAITALALLEETGGGDPGPSPDVNATFGS